MGSFAGMAVLDSEKITRRPAGREVSMLILGWVLIVLCIIDTADHMATARIELLCAIICFAAHSLGNAIRRVGK